MIIGVLFSCRQEDQVRPSSSLPAHLYTYFQIVDFETKEDLFFTNNQYHIDSVKLYNNRISDEPWQDNIWHEQRGDTTVLMVSNILLGTHGKKYVPRIWILQLSEEDYDTVKVAYSATSEYRDEWVETFPDPYDLHVNKVWVYYNDTLINDWYLKDNEELRQRILGSEDPLINVIYKKTEKVLD